MPFGQKVALDVQRAAPKVAFKHTGNFADCCHRGAGEMRDY